MKVIGLTGGIGSGKSTLLKWFQSKGVPCFESDRVGKDLLNSELKQDVISSFGFKLYPKGILDRKQLAKLVFKDAIALKKLNNIVHPAVGIAFEKFKVENINELLIIKESAILFESGIYKIYDSVILVCASKEKRVLRVMKRDGINRGEVLERMAKQWDDPSKRLLADFVIENNILEFAKYQLEVIFKKLLMDDKD